VPALLSRLPNLGRGQRVTRLGDPDGDFWHVVDVAPKKPALTAALTPPKIASESSNSTAIEATSPDLSSSEAAQEDTRTSSQESQAFVGPSGFTIKHREFSAKVYGVEFRRGVPLSGRVRGIRHAYKRIWKMYEQSGSRVSVQDRASFSATGTESKNLSDVGTGAPL
jgi:hypothetical protein